MRRGSVGAAAAFAGIVGTAVLGTVAMLKYSDHPAAAQQPGETATPGAMGGMGCSCSGGGSSGMMRHPMGGSGMMGGMMGGQAATQVSPGDAAALGMVMPAGATVDTAQNRITFTTATVSFTVLASPDDGPDMTFRVAGLADPTIAVPRGAMVTVQFINADADVPHGWVLSAAQPPFSYMAMMSAPPAFGGSIAMPMRQATQASMWSEMTSFTATVPGSYNYLCPVMGHAQQGMYGSFVVVGS